MWVANEGEGVEQDQMMARIPTSVRNDFDSLLWCEDHGVSWRGKYSWS